MKISASKDFQLLSFCISVPTFILYWCNFFCVLLVRWRNGNQIQYINHLPLPTSNTIQEYFLYTFLRTNRFLEPLSIHPKIFDYLYSVPLSRLEREKRDKNIVYNSSIRQYLVYNKNEIYKVKIHIKIVILS